MSLNKVDAALQSVGITLQDVNGQFRNFDDVILELSKKWDTLDANAQRYIATTMAGNRQQSRFLALVGNYEEYSKALETAANAEDTGTLQTLKSLDSISAKWNQLKTNIQQFYASSGLEQIFKAALDGMNNFLSKANTLPKLFGKIPTTVISMLSVIIMSIKQSGQNMIQALTGPINEMNKKLNELKEKPVEITIKAKADTASAVAAGQQVAQTAQQAANGTTQGQALSGFFNKYDTEQNADLILLEKATGITDSNKLVTLAKQLKGLNVEERKALLSSNDLGQALNNLINPAEKSLTALEKFRGSSIGGALSKHTATIAMVASTLSAAALSIEDSSKSAVESSKVLSGGVSTIAGGLLGILGQWQYAIPMLLSGIPSLIDGIIYTTEEKLENATKKAEELNNEALKKKSEYKDLKNQTTELKRLEEARYDSAEAMQEYLDYSNQMADTYPELIGYIDAEGNSIIDLANSYSFLESARIAAGLAAKEAIIGDIEKSGVSLQDAQEKFNNFISGNTTEYKNINGQGFDISTAFGNATKWDLETAINQTIIKPLLEKGYSIGEAAELGKLVSLKKNEGKDNLITEGYINPDQLYSSFKNYDFDTDINSIKEELQNQLALKNGITEDNLNFLASLNEALESGTGAYGEFISNEDNFKQLLEISKKISTDSPLYSFIDNAIQDYKQYQQLKVNLALAEKQQKATQRKSMATFAYYDNEASDRAVGEEIANFNEIATNFLMRRWKEVGGDLENYLTSNESADYDEFESQFQEFWQTLSATEKEAFNSLLGNQGMYSRSQFEQALKNAGVDKGLQEELMAQWSEQYRYGYSNFINGLLNAHSKDNSYLMKGSEKLATLPYEFYSTVKDFYDKINKQIANGVINSVQGSNILDTYSSLIAQANKADNNIELLNIIKEADLTTLSGLYALQDALSKAGFEMGELFSGLADNINVNLITETQTILTDLSEKLKTYKEDLDKASGGMSFEDAISMAEKIGGSLSDFKFEDGEYFLQDLGAINEYYNNFESDLVDSIKNRIENRINSLRGFETRYGTSHNSEIEQLQKLFSDIDEYIAQYTTYLENTFLLSTKQYGAFISAIGAEGKFDTSQLMAAAAQSESALYNLLSEAGVDEANTYISVVKDALSSIQNDIISRIEESSLAKGQVESVYIGDLVKGLGLGEEFNTITDGNYQELYKKIFGNNREAYNNAMATYFENSSKDIQSMLSSMLGSLDSIDASAVAELGTAMGENWETITQYFTENLDGTFSATYQSIMALATKGGQNISTEVYDALKEYFDSITSIISNGLKGSMSSNDVENLNKFLGFDVSFTKTAEGLKLTKESAIEVYLALKDIDAIQAQITFNDLADNLKEAGSGYEDVAETMRTIAKLNKELANVPVDDSRRKELEKELQVAQEILRVRSSDPDSFNFMDKALPEGMQGPENYWNSVGKAYKAMNESAKSGYMEIQDYVNIVNQMSAMAEAAGVDFEIKGMNAAQLIEKGMSALKNVDGEGVKVAMSGIGFDFLSGAEEMGLSFDDGIKEVAKSQIKMLDAAIQILETIVAMEDIGNIDKNGDGINLDDILDFSVKGEVNYQEEYNTVRQSLLKNEELRTQLDEFFVNGKSLTEWLQMSAEEFEGQAEEAQQAYIDALKALYEMSQGDYDLNDIMGSLQKLIETNQLSGTIIVPVDENGVQLIVKVGEPNALKIEWDSEKTEKLLEEYNTYSKEGLQGIVEDWAKGNTDNFTYLDYYLTYRVTEKISVDEDGNYEFLGVKYSKGEEEALGKAIQDYESVESELGLNTTATRDGGNLTLTTTYGFNNEVKISFNDNSDSNYTSTFNGKEYKAGSMDELIDKIWQEQGYEYSKYGYNRESFGQKFKSDASVEVETEVKPILKKDSIKDGELSQEVVDEYGLDTSLINNISAAITSADWTPVGSAIGEGISKALSGGEKEASGEGIGELTIKPASLNIDVTGAKISLSGLAEDGSLPLPDGTIGTVSGAASEIQISGDYTPVIPEKGITLTYDTVSGKTTVIKITPTKYGDDKQTGKVKIDGTYNSVEGKANSATIDITTYTVDITDAEGNTETVTVDGQANLTALINGLTKGEDGTWTLTVGDASVTIDTPNYDEIVQKLAELSAPKTKTITVSYEEPKGYTLSYTKNSSKVYGDGTTGTTGKRVTKTFKTAEEAYAFWSNANFSDRNGISSGRILGGTSTPTLITPSGDEYKGADEIAEALSELSTIEAQNVTVESSNVEVQGQPNEPTGFTPEPGPAPQPSPTPTPQQQQQEEVIIDTTGIVEQAQGAADEMGSAIQGAVDGIDTSGAQDAISDLNSKIGSIPSSGASKISNLSSAISGIPSKREVNINYKVTVSSNEDGKITGATGNISSWGMHSASGSLTFSKGNVALAKGKTLMGELGPELVVSNGHYYVVGQNGAEFVDLADDAIVFNHLQTQSLLNNSGISGRGTPVTNEKKATSLATGNAMASASDAIAQLRAICAMWQSMLDASARDLGAMAGSGGGGGGGGGGDDLAAVVGDYERWYNLLRQIAKWEQKITYEQAKRENMRSGYDRVDSLEKELDMLKKQRAAYAQLAEEQGRYYNQRRQDLENMKDSYALIFTYDQDGLMQYVEGENRGLNILAELNKRDENGALTGWAVNAKKQLEYLRSIGFNTDLLKNNEDGTKTKKPEEMMQNFWDNIDAWMNELDSLYDTYNENLTSVEEVTTRQNEILQLYIDNQLSLEEKLLQAIQDRAQAEIDRLTDEKEALEEATQSFIDGLTDALDKERDLYNRNQNQKETDKLQRQLAILMRSGGSASEIQSLRDQIDSRLQDEYFDRQQEQIDAIQEASNNQLEKLQEQIDLMTETLDEQIKNGLLWEEVYDMMNNWTPEQIVQFLDQYLQSRRENSALQNEQDREEDRISAEMFVGRRDLEARNAAWERYYNGLTYNDDVKRDNAQAAQTAFNEAYASGGETAAIEAANRIYSAATQTPPEPEETQPTEDTSQTGGQNAKVKGGQMNVRKSASGKAKGLGIVKSGKSFKAVGYKGGWLKVEDADVGKGKKVSGYMKYSGYSKYYEGIDIDKLPKYSQGGLVDFTGPVMVHGSKKKPEAFVSAEDRALLKSTIFNSNNNVLRDFVNALENRSNSNSNVETVPNVVIEEVNLEIASGTIANDYDAKRAGEKILEEMVRISRKTTNRVSSRR